MLTVEDPSSCRDGPPVGHSFSFSHKKEKKEEKCIIHNSNQS